MRKVVICYALLPLKIMSGIPKQLIYAKKLGDALHEEYVLSANIEGLDVEISKVDEEMAQTHKAIYEIFTEGLSTVPGASWVGALLSIQDPEHMSFFCDDSLNVQGLEVVDAQNKAQMFYFGGIKSMRDFNEVAVFTVEEVLKENGYL